MTDIRMTDMPQNHGNVDKPDIWKHEFVPKIGFNISAVGEYYVNSKINSGMEPGYIMKGTNFTESESKLNLHYLNLPILLKYKVYNHTGIYLGPKFSKLIKAKLDFDGSSINMDSFYNEKIDTSVLLGVDFQITKYIGLGARYNYGLTKVSETVWTDET